MTKKEYVEKAVSGIKSKSLRREIEEELSDHLDELTQLWIGRGFDEAAAEQKAVEEMGAPEKTAEELGNLHSGLFPVVIKILIALFFLLCSVVLLTLWRVLGLFFRSVYEAPLDSFGLLLEAILFCFCAAPLLVGVRRKEALPCVFAAIYSVPLLLLGGYEMISELFSEQWTGHTFVSPGLQSFAVAISGRWDVFDVFPQESVCAQSPVVFALTVLLYLLIPVSAVVMTVFYAGKRTRRGKKAQRAGRTVRRVIYRVGAFLLIVDLSFTFILDRNLYRNDAKKSVTRYDGWRVVQSDERFPAAELEERPESEASAAYYKVGYAYYTEGNIFNDYYQYYARSLAEDEGYYTVRIRDRIPGLLVMYEYSTQREIVREKRYLLAVPVCGEETDYDGAVWFDLEDGGPIRLKFSDNPDEYSYLDLVAVEQ
ncbi:MAG: hypothetical protein IK118_09010 [Clostridia bacterium]|nr:hypothetical protein [Clostridia bacterium]